MLHHVPTGDASGEPPRTRLQALRDAAIPTVDDVAFGQRLDAIAEHRGHLTAFAEESLWHGEELEPS